MYRLGLASLRSTWIFRSLDRSFANELLWSSAYSLISIETVHHRNPREIVPDSSSTFQLGLFELCPVTTRQKGLWSCYRLSDFIPGSRVWHPAGQSPFYELRDAGDKLIYLVACPWFFNYCEAHCGPMDLLNTSWPPDCSSSAGGYSMGSIVGSLQCLVWLIFCWLLNSFHATVSPEHVRGLVWTSGLGRRTLMEYYVRETIIVFPRVIHEYYAAWKE